MLLTINSKLDKTNKLNKVKVVAFNLPPVKTCPQAKQCIRGCYACQGRYTFKTIRAKLQANLDAANSPVFQASIQTELNKLKPTHVRLHTSGDIFSQEYLNTWISIANSNSSIIFYAYTKSIELVKNTSNIPSNMVFIFSLGGLQDALINPNTDRHARVFPSVEALQASGYTDASKDDLLAIGSNHRIGLVYHGVKNIKNTDW